MKAILEFDLNDIDDKKDHERCIKALNMAMVISQFWNNSKRDLELKIENNKSFSPQDVIDSTFQLFGNLLETYDVNINNLID